MKPCSRLFVCGLLVASTSVRLRRREVDTAQSKETRGRGSQGVRGDGLHGVPPIADTREQRFQGKVTELSALCRGGQNAVQFRMTPWVDFTNYWGTGDLTSLPKGYLYYLGTAVSWRLGRAARSRVPAHRADQVQPVRQQRDVSGLCCRRGTAWRAGAEDVAGDAAAARAIRTTRGGRRRRAGLQRAI